MLPNNLKQNGFYSFDKKRIPRLKIFGNEGDFKRISDPEMLGCIQLQSSSVKHRKNSSEKHSMVKPILINFVNFSTIFCPRLSEEKHYYL